MSRSSARRADAAGVQCLGDGAGCCRAGRLDLANDRQNVGREGVRGGAVGCVAEGAGFSQVGAVPQQRALSLLCSESGFGAR